MRFDDEQIADEKSIQNMKMHYAGINKNTKISVLSERQKNFPINVLSLGKLVKKSNKYLIFLKEIVGCDFKSFLNELIKVNDLELEKLKNEYSELNGLETENPELVLRPNSLQELNVKMAENELETIKMMLSLYENETKEEPKQMLKAMIERRLDAFEKIFLWVFI